MNGIIGINKKGQVLSLKVDEQTIIPYLLMTLNNTDLAFKLVRHASLPGADDVFQAGSLVRRQRLHNQSILGTVQEMDPFK